MKKTFLFAMLFAFSVSLFAQVSTNPADDFYTQVERWETLGLIERQPSLRPYALPVVEKILNTVIESNSEKEAEVAKKIYEKTFNRPWTLVFDGTAYAKKNEDGLSKRVLAKYGVEGDSYLLNFMSAGYQLDFLTDVFPKETVLPEYRYFPYYMADGYGRIKNYMEVDGNLAFNFGDFYFQTGINHNSFGPFYTEGLALSPTAKHTANFSLLYQGKNWNYTQAMFVLSATNAVDTTAMYPNKWLMMHNFEWNMCPQLLLGFYETVIYGKRFDPSYMIPMLFMVTQGVTGYSEDNLLMGGTFVYKPVNSLSILGDFYLDDAGFTGIKKYHGIKLHCAGELGIKYVPENFTALQMLQLNYTAVTPIMYAHCQNTINQDGSSIGSGSINTVNYQVYTTAGQKLGCSLDPNSDRIALSAKFKPVAGLSIDIGGAYIRHANITESLSRDEKLSYLASPKDYFATDGSINQYVGYFENGDPDNYKYLKTANHKTMFLTQSTKQYTLQGDLKLGYEFPETKAGKFALSAGYTIEFIRNYGVGTNMFEGETIFYNVETEKYYDSYDSDSKTWGNELTDSDLDVIIAKAESDWKATLRNVINHYLTINFKYSF